MGILLDGLAGSGTHWPTAFHLVLVAPGTRRFVLRRLERALDKLAHKKNVPLSSPKYIERTSFARGVRWGYFLGFFPFVCPSLCDWRQNPSRDAPIPSD